MSSVGPGRERCSRGRDAARCCKPGAWDRYALHPYASAEPLDERLVDVAAQFSLDPHDLDDLVEREWGWEGHDTGYREAAGQAAEYLAGAA